MEAEVNTVALCIIHASHRPERVPLMARLRAELGIPSREDLEAPGQTLGWPHSSLVAYKEETTRGKHWVWHTQALEWLGAQNATHALTLQDDVRVPAEFWKWLFALIDARPNDVICLDCAHPGARQVFVEGAPGYYTFDGLIGIGHIEPIEVVRDFATWLEEEVNPGPARRLSEDMLFAFYCMHRRKRIFAPVPCIIDHDVDIGSTNLGFDEHIYRKPQVTWNEIDRVAASVHREQLEDPLWLGRDAPFLGKFYDDAFDWLPLVLRDKATGSRLAREYAEIETPDRYAKFFLRATSKSA